MARRSATRLSGHYSGNLKVANRVPVQAPQAPQSTAAQPLPINEGYENTLAANLANYNNTLAQIGYGRTQLNQQYGFHPTFDPSGNITGEAVDPSNPFSRAALLQQSYARNKAGYGQSMASRGQLYSSAYQADQDFAGQQYGQSYDALRRAYEAAQQGLTYKGTSALNALSGANTSAYSQYYPNAAAATPDTGGTELGFGGTPSPRAGASAPKGKAPRAPRVRSGAFVRKVAGRFVGPGRAF